MVIVRFDTMEGRRCLGCLSFLDEENHLVRSAERVSGSGSESAG